MFFSHQRLTLGSINQDNQSIVLPSSEKFGQREEHFAPNISFDSQRLHKALDKWSDRYIRWQQRCRDASKSQDCSSHDSAVGGGTSHQAPLVAPPAEPPHLKLIMVTFAIHRKRLLE